MAKITITSEVEEFKTIEINTDPYNVWGDHPDFRQDELMNDIKYGVMEALFMERNAKRS